MSVSTASASAATSVDLAELSCAAAGASVRLLAGEGLGRWRSHAKQPQAAVPVGESAALSAPSCNTRVKRSQHQRHTLEGVRKARLQGPAVSAPNTLLLHQTGPPNTSAVGLVCRGVFRQHLLSIGEMFAGRRSLRWDAHSSCVGIVCCDARLGTGGAHRMPALCWLRAAPSQTLQSAHEGPGLVRVDAHPRQRPAVWTRTRPPRCYPCESNALLR